MSETNVKRLSWTWYRLFTYTLRTCASCLGGRKILIAAHPAPPHHIHRNLRELSISLQKGSIWISTRCLFGGVSGEISGSCEDFALHDLSRNIADNKSNWNTGRNFRVLSKKVQTGWINNVSIWGCGWGEIFLPLWRCDFCFLHKKPLEKSGGTGPLVACSGWIQRLTNGSENNHKHNNNKKKTSETYLDASSWRALYFPSRFLLRSSILTQFDWRRKRKSSGFDPDLLTLVWYIISVPLLFQTTLFQWHFDLARTADIPRWKKKYRKIPGATFFGPIGNCVHNLCTLRWIHWTTIWADRTFPIYIPGTESWSSKNIIKNSGIWSLVYVDLDPVLRRKCVHLLFRIQSCCDQIENNAQTRCVGRRSSKPKHRLLCHHIRQAEQ